MHPNKLLSFSKKSFSAVVIGVAALAAVGLTTPGPVVAPQGPGQPLALKMDTVVTGLKTPWALAILPDGDMLVTERGGTLRLVHNGKLDPKPIEDVPEVLAKGQGGLLDVVLHPDYAKNGWIYLTYASPAAPGEAGDADGANTALMRAKLKNHKLVDKKVIFKATPNVKSNPHFGGRVAFDREGYLYLTLGERGQKPEAQQPTNHLGTVVRLYDDGRVPKDNPFVGSKKGLGEIYSYGHRNPQGLALDPNSGKIWEHEHGPQGGDEVNIVKKGANYGWPAITFGIDYDDSIISEDTARAGMEQPIIYWRPSIAPCGMTFVTSPKFKDWNGDLLVGSLKFNYVMHCTVKGDQITKQEKILEGIGRVRTIREGADGNIYVVAENTGTVFRVSPM
ncbi:PQQ-dependent sugar dehydrogenase [Persicitalea sp.]|uniref:PQQ-dependent sugar dehydrogenase n=1 Tax=Persicitalea sp. TaxID=3100273 RepID=UPI003593F619